MARRIRGPRWIVVAALAACTPAKDPAPPMKIDIAATALATMDRDANAMLELVRAVYLEAGVTVATNVTLELGKLDDVRTSYDDTLIRITLPTPATSPDQARAYWQAQGKLTGVELDGMFTDDVELYRLARFAVFVALAHEVGHFLHQSYVGPLDPAGRELLSDRLAIALLDRLSVRPELAALVTRYRALLTEWHAAIPDGTRIDIPADADLDAWVADHPLPAAPAAAASLAIARQVRLLAKPPKLGPLVAEALLAPHDLRLQKIEYGTTRLVVTSGRDVPPEYRAVTGAAGSVRELSAALLGPDNKFRAVTCSGGACDITGEAGTSTKLALTNVLGGEMASFERVLDVTISGDQLWLLLTTAGEAPQTALAIIDLTRPDAVRPTATWTDVLGGRLAASPSGAVSVMLQRPDSWTIDRYDSPSAKPASWTFKVADGGDTDGRAGAAGGALGDCTANDAGTIYCAAGVRIRVLEKDRLWTLAGGNRDWVDATDPKKVAFTSPVRLRATPTGLVLVDRKYAEDGTATWKVRQVELKK